MFYWISINVLIEFSTEADKNTHETLTKKIEGTEAEVDQLLADAFRLAEGADNKKVLAFVLMSRASLESSRYMQYKMDFIRGILKAKIWLLLHRLGYEIPILFGFKHFRVLKAYVNSFTGDYLKAARLFEEIDDDGAGFAYYNLAVHLRSAYSFSRAKNYLRKAKTIANRHKNALLAANIKALEISKSDFISILKINLLRLGFCQICNPRPFITLFSSSFHLLDNLARGLPI